MRRPFSLFALFLALTARAQINLEWTTPLPPSQIADSLYYVGSEELAAYLVTTPAREHPPQRQPRNVVAAASHGRGEAGVPVGGYENPAQ